ncbi:OLC1v1032519C1 [Oldenlandia corymbosa var. corymbosa]|uniref:OLC1v1032519C1 n=1 Tax=Oldenlandia corymbosa var. corymbosa TaxID=529605 RepID=A0AAV1CLD1_OLDCO|nr:OLC1v1032519C1 [Oldenlandia corymbosa var. corymbosa]
MEETSTVELLTKVELDLTYSSQKSVNLQTLFMHVLSWQNDIKSAVEYDNISPDFIEKAMQFDLLNAILNAEVRELDNFIGTIEVMVVDIRHKINCGKLKALSPVEQNKWHDIEESLRQSQDHILEMKIQLAKLQMTSVAFNQNEWNANINMELSENFRDSETYLKPQLQLVEERHILRMLEKSLSRELDLEKQLKVMKQNEQDIVLKLRLTEQVAQHMEEASEVIWGRFLEAENSAEVLLGISKEMVARLQIAKFSLDNSIQREKLLDSKLQYYAAAAQSKVEETSMVELDSLTSQLLAKTDEAVSLSEKVKVLEEKLKESTSQLKVAQAAYETSQEQLAEVDMMIESMRETIDDAEGRAESAEAKVSALTDANSELTEELNFLKGSNDSNNKKVSLLEKQLRDLELQLQHARASSEASLEQQNMLYTAIWDMETLIDELKQKVSRAENKSENAEEQRMVLSQANLDLKKEVEFLRSRIDSLETTLDHVTVEKMASAKDISIKTNVIMDMVMQLALERERVKKQVNDLAKENKFLKVKLRKTKKDECLTAHDDNDRNDKMLPTSRADSADASLNAALESFSKTLVEETLYTASSDQNEMEIPSSAENGNNLDSKMKDNNLIKARKSSRMYVVMAMLIVLLAGLAAYLLNSNHATFQFIDAYNPLVF